MSKVLIIEDEVSIAELEKDYLELSGFDVEIESDGARGVEKALASDFDRYILHRFLWYLPRRMILTRFADWD